MRPSIWDKLGTIGPILMAAGAPNTTGRNMGLLATIPGQLRALEEAQQTRRLRETQMETADQLRELRKSAERRAEEKHPFEMGLLGAKAAHLLDPTTDMPASMRALAEMMKRQGMTPDEIDRAFMNQDRYKFKINDVGDRVWVDTWAAQTMGPGTVDVELPAAETPKTDDDPALAFGGSSLLQYPAKALSPLGVDIAGGTTAAIDDVNALNQRTSIAIKRLEGVRDSVYMDKQAKSMMPQPGAFTSDERAARKAEDMVGLLDSWIADLETNLKNPRIGAKNKQAMEAALPEFRSVRSAYEMMAQQIRGSPDPGLSGGPKPGAVEGGYMFKGGDPADKNNWVKQ